MNLFADRVAVITGAGSGIGRALAVALASKGARLALSDVDTTGLAATARRVEAFGADVDTARVDVSEREAVFRYAGEVVRRFGQVHQLYNNAGIEYHGAFERSALEDVERIMNVDFWGVVNFSKAFLPHLISSGDGHLVNVSSLFGLMSVPGQTAYSSAKFAVRGFTESLRQEMLAAGHPVKVTCVHPSSVRTAIARNAGGPAGDDRAAVVNLFDRKLARISPDDAARTILRGVRRNKARVLVGADAKLLDAFVRIVGPSYQRVAAAVAARALTNH
ncbi:SDR family oxidoreductase [Streptomyces sp. MBT62]|uniref:SDR family NAD(P)-dependent oxidoreductase n=1 Tax=Streptomyces sp. MBT62 TaxID=2800410 RepID=UPI00190CABEB|nr:SDR family NAD(P)-dependent oxidoreductase [Streptomyces sp. MBT62]MBK3567995.1 SDR family NAD(P)-dependent oxidoreductase [Streptomyces sp. MBT62]